jgi:GAF domain-containing protein
MVINESHRPFIEKVAAETRDYILALLEENDRLRARLSEAEEESRDFAARYVEVEQQNTNLANLYVASYQLHGTLDRERVLATIKEVIINLIGSEELAIWELDTNGDALVLADSFGIDAEEWQRVPLDGKAGMIGLVVKSGHAFVAGQAILAPNGPQQNLSACIPLSLDGVLVGAIGVFRLLPQKTGFEPIDLEMFELLASHAATALYCTRRVVRP